jgi:hypothetical protein
VTDETTERFRPALEEAMDAVRDIVRAHGHGEVKQGALFLELEERGQRIAAAHPRGSFLASSDLAAEGAHAFSVRAALDALGEL